jgi:hypothetical protein
MARRYQARPKPIILQKGDAGIPIILDSNGTEGDLSSSSTAAIVWRFYMDPGTSH